MEYWKWLSKKWQEQQKWAILKSFLENLANCPKQRSFFGPLKTFEPKLWPFWHFYIQRWKNLDLAPVPHLTNFHFLIYGHVILVQDLNSISATFGSWFSTQFPHGAAMMPTVTRMSTVLAQLYSGILCP